MSPETHEKTHGKPLFYSGLLHLLLIVLLVFGLPDFFHKTPDPEPLTLSVDILPIAPISNVKPQEEKPDTPEVKKPVAEKQAEKKPTPTAAAEEAEATPPPPPKPVEAKEVVPDTPAPKPEEKKPEPPKPAPKKPEKKPAKKQDDDLESLLKSLKKSTKAEEAKQATVTKSKNHKAVSPHYDASQPMSMSEKDAIRNQFIKCWSVPAGAKDAANLAVTLHIEVNQDGSVTKVDLAEGGSRFQSDSYFRAAAESAMRAVHRCSPLQHLPSDKYGTWREMELTFDPRDVF